MYPLLIGSPVPKDASIHFECEIYGQKITVIVSDQEGKYHIYRDGLRHIYVDAEGIINALAHYWQFSPLNPSISRGDHVRHSSTNQ